MRGFSQTIVYITKSINKAKWKTSLKTDVICVCLGSEKYKPVNNHLCQAHTDQPTSDVSQEHQHTKI